MALSVQVMVTYEREPKFAEKKCRTLTLRLKSIREEKKNRIVYFYFYVMSKCGSIYKKKKELKRGDL